MQLIDWLLVAGSLLLVLFIGIYTKYYMRSVADFMSGGRLAGRYLLAVSRGELQAGAVVFVAVFEVISHSGFTYVWWSWISVPVALIVAISGFVIYRFRETRAMTLAQFFEVRYSKGFRLFTGGLAFVAGIMNFGIIPAVGARFFVYFLGLPAQVNFLSVTLPTYIPLMAFFLVITLLLTLAGGLITVMITDCIGGILSQVFYLVIIAVLVAKFHWPQISHALADAPPGQSMLNPFDSMGIKDFNLWYVLMTMFVGVYGTMAWQNASAYNSAAITAHESRMAGILGRWREFGKNAVIVLLAICAVTFLRHPDFARESAMVPGVISRIPEHQIQEQMRVPIALSYLLPAGAKGVLCAVLLLGIFGGDSTHLHSWGGIFVQDLLVPLRRKPFSPEQHIRALRIAIIGVTIFAFLFGSLFRQTEYVAMWFQVTMGVFVGGAGSAIIGGLYWKKGTTQAAWASLLTGSIFSGGGILARQISGGHFVLNGVQISFYASLLAIAVYVVVSLLTCREEFNMDRMLHRGEYAAVTALVGGEPEKSAGRRITFGRLIGIDEQFTLADKWTAGGLFAWSMFWFIVMIAGTVWNLVAPWPASVWSIYWYINGVGVPIFMAVVTAVWFTWGGLRDTRDLFRRLARQKINPLDNGAVVNHRNLDESVVAVEMEEKRSTAPGAMERPVPHA